jgi:hypothetical protein
MEARQKGKTERKRRGAEEREARRLLDNTTLPLPRPARTVTALEVEHTSTTAPPTA